MTNLARFSVGRMLLHLLAMLGRFAGFSDLASYADINGFLAADLRTRRTGEI